MTGKILQWNIADLFDVQQWHFDNNDCSHFCYLLPLYESAFERLGLLYCLRWIDSHSYWYVDEHMYEEWTASLNIGYTSLVLSSAAMVDH